MTFTIVVPTDPTILGDDATLSDVRAFVAEGMQYGRRIARDDWAGRLDNGPEAAAAVVREMCARIAREHHRLGLGLAQRKLLPLLGDLERWDMQRGPR